MQSTCEAPTSRSYCELGGVSWVPHTHAPPDAETAAAAPPLGVAGLVELSALPAPPAVAALAPQPHTRPSTGSRWEAAMYASPVSDASVWYGCCSGGGSGISSTVCGSQLY
jgi:hypothetical protein